MDGANKRFMANRAGWLANHLIVYAVGKGAANPLGQGVSNVGTELPVHSFDLVKIGAMMNENGTGAKEYELRNLGDRATSKNSRAINAYFLPWGSGQTYCGRLGINAEFFFTPTLNGCTFVHTGGGPNPSVAHSNMVDPLTTLADQPAMDADLTAKFGGGALPPTRIVKTDYKRIPIGLEDYRATVVGIRTGNAWNFYYQNYQVDQFNSGHGTILRPTGIGLCTAI